jgi:hypothetical protein
MARPFTVGIAEVFSFGLGWGVVVEVAGIW